MPAPRTLSPDWAPSFARTPVVPVSLDLASGLEANASKRAVPRRSAFGCSIEGVATDPVAVLGPALCGTP